MMQEEVNCIGLATGSTPITLYQEMVNSSLDFSDKISSNRWYCGLERIIRKATITLAKHC